MDNNTGIRAAENEDIDTTPDGEVSSRRQLLRKSAVVVGASMAAVGLSSKVASAADDDPMILGGANIAESQTVLQSSATAGSLTVLNLGTTEGNGIVGAASAPDSVGVGGVNDASTGEAVGVLGVSSSSLSGIGVRGEGPLRGVVGESPSIGVQGDSISIGVHGRGGLDSTGSAQGVWGECYAPNGNGVLGQAQSDGASTAVGVRGTTVADGGVGVQGEALAGGGTAVEAKAISGIGVDATSESGVGVNASSTSTIAVRGIGPAGVVGFANPENPGDTSVGVAAFATSSTDLALWSVGRTLLTNDQSDNVPAAPLHVLQEEAGTPVELLLQLESDTNPQQTFVNNTTGDKWFFAMTADGQFKISKDGTGAVEAKFFDNGDLTLKGALNQSSDVNIKHDIAVVDPDEVLEKLAAMPVSTWKYNADPNVTHLGPMAQDFAAAFGLGRDETTIASVDADGVALAAIQALHAQNQQLQANQERLERQVAELLARDN